MPNDDPTDETAKTNRPVWLGKNEPTGDPLVDVLTEAARIIERFSGALTANEKADDELRSVVTIALTEVGKRNAVLDRIAEDEKRRADATERQATAEEAQLALAETAQVARARTAEARWQAITETVGGYTQRVFKHPITVALGGAILFIAAQSIASNYGLTLADYMPKPPDPPASVAPQTTLEPVNE